MNIEEKLKEYILSNHKSIREFVKVAGLPYTTMDGILKRGIANASIGNVLKICNALGISADELGNGKIVPVPQTDTQNDMDIERYIQYKRQNAEECNLSLDGERISPDEFIFILDGIEFSIKMIRKNRNR